MRAIKAVGNYAEIFNRNVGKGLPLMIERGLNAPWNEGGRLYAPPVRWGSSRCHVFAEPVSKIIFSDRAFGQFKKFSGILLLACCYFEAIYKEKRE